jgi:hypothetical protein
VTDLTAAKEGLQQARDEEKQAKENASTIQAKLKYAPGTATASDRDAAGQRKAGAENQAKVLADNVASAASNASRAHSDLQAHAFVGEQIRMHIAAVEEGLRLARNLARRLAQREVAAQQGLHAAERVSDLSKLATASKLRERAGDDFQSLVDDMADGSQLEAVWIAPHTIRSVLERECDVAA